MEGGWPTVFLSKFYIKNLLLLFFLKIFTCIKIKDTGYKGKILYMIKRETIGFFFSLSVRNFSQLKSEFRKYINILCRDTLKFIKRVWICTLMYILKCCFCSRAPWMDKYGPPQRTKYRVVVENLSTRVSWQVTAPIRTNHI